MTTWSFFDTSGFAMKQNRKSKSLLSFVLTAAALLFFGCTEARAESPGADTPPPAQPAAPAPAAQTTPAPKARREDVEPKTLADAKTELKAVRDDRDKAEADFAQATADLAAARAENTRLAEQFNAATAAAEQSRAALADMTAARDLAVSENTRTLGQLTAANSNVSRLEQLCKLKGVSPSAAVPLVEVEASEDDERAKLVKALESASTPLAKGQAAEALRKFDLSRKG
jgi:hypothetical protein